MVQHILRISYSYFLPSEASPIYFRRWKSGQEFSLHWIYFSTSTRTCSSPHMNFRSDRRAVLFTATSLSHCKCTYLRLHLGNLILREIILIQRHFGLLQVFQKSQFLGQQKQKCTSLARLASCCPPNTVDVLFRVIWRIELHNPTRPQNKWERYVWFQIRRRAYYRGANISTSLQKYFSQTAKPAGKTVDTICWWIYSSSTVRRRDNRL